MALNHGILATIYGNYSDIHVLYTCSIMLKILKCVHVHVQYYYNMICMHHEDKA